VVLAGAEPVSVVGGPRAAVCLHGFGGSPGSIAPLVAAFVEDGWTVEAPLLPGHGTTVDDLAATTWNIWLAAARQAVADALTGAGGGPVVVVGQSMGGSLGLALAAGGVGLAGLVTVNAPVRPQDAEALDMVGEMVSAGELTVPAGRSDLADAAAVDIAYDEVSLPAWLSLMAGLDRLAGLLGAIRVPTLVVRGALDTMIDATHAELLLASLAGPVEQLVLPSSGHVAALDVDRVLLCERALAFGRTWAGPRPR
jgi:carboxylesterase